MASEASQTELDLKTREVEVQENELRLKEAQFDHEKGKGPLANVAVAVTAIAGVSAIIFQGVGAYEAHQEKVAAVSNLAAAGARADKEFDLKGIELFVDTEDKVVGCDAAAADAQVSLFTSLFPEMMVRFRAAASSKAQHCAAVSGNAAVAKGGTGQVITQAAEKARYTTLSGFAPAVSQPTVSAGSLSTIYIQIADESQRGQALALQQALITRGYACPGIQLVAAAPRVPQVRIYREDESDAAATLVKIAAATLNIGPPDVRSVASQYKNLPSGVAEFWFPALRGAR